MSCALQDICAAAGHNTVLLHVFTLLPDQCFTATASRLLLRSPHVGASRVCLGKCSDAYLSAAPAAASMRSLKCSLRYHCCAQAHPQHAAQASAATHNRCVVLPAGLPTIPAPQ